MQWHLEEKWEPSQHLRLGPRKTKKTWVEMARTLSMRVYKFTERVSAVIVCKAFMIMIVRTQQ